MRISLDAITSAYLAPILAWFMSNGMGNVWNKQLCPNRDIIPLKTEHLSCSLTVIHTIRLQNVDENSCILFYSTPRQQEY